jgi:hypothetical protein
MTLMMSQLMKTKTTKLRKKRSTQLLRECSHQKELVPLTLVINLQMSNTNPVWETIFFKHSPFGEWTETSTHQNEIELAMFVIKVITSTFVFDSTISDKVVLTETKKFYFHFALKLGISMQHH